MDTNYRERLEVIEDKVFTADKKYAWTKNEFIKHLHHNREKISPNVLLRPVFQEMVLPNLAYIGGGGELSYWLQYKQMFEATIQRGRDAFPP